ncbi:unnamed protein product [Linum tenue]|uniref:Uncharacterized protein n=1 Tax=Linum tenue TaxID=586396 RepID=A0AAV0LAK8_9ROSI|nr:unnamed protein product [Linum tenue]
MDPDLEIKDQMKVGMEGLPQKESESLPPHGNENSVPCTDKLDDGCCPKEALPENKAEVQQTTEDLEVDIVNCSNSQDVGDVETENDDTSESISSFSSSFETENDLMLTDNEVESYMCRGGHSTSLFDSYGAESQSRRKRLTEHWRRFIRPLMWRCKWIELQLKEFQSQTLKYDRELGEIEQRKTFDRESLVAEGHEAKSKPFSSSNPRMKVLKRKKRKRYEEMNDMTSFMLQNNIISYYEHKKTANDGASMEGDPTLPERAGKADPKSAFHQEGWAPLHSKDGVGRDEDILMKIGALQSQVHRLRSRIDVVMRDNPGKFSYLTRLTSPEPDDVLACSENPGSFVENGDRAVRSLYPVEDHIPGIPVSSQGEAASRPHMPETLDRPSDGAPSEIKNEAFVTLNQPARKEIAQAVEDLVTQPEEQKPELPTDVQTASNPIQARAPLLQMHYPGKSLPKSRSRVVTSNKRKRGKRRSGRGGWNRKPSTEK